jgi:hypothetical protein
MAFLQNAPKCVVYLLISGFVAPSLSESADWPYEPRRPICDSLVHDNGVDDSLLRQAVECGHVFRIAGSELDWLYFAAPRRENALIAFRYTGLTHKQHEQLRKDLEAVAARYRFQLGLRDKTISERMGNEGVVRMEFLVSHEMDCFLEDEWRKELAVVAAKINPSGDARFWYRATKPNLCLVIQ